MQLDDRVIIALGAKLDTVQDKLRLEKSREEKEAFMRVEYPDVYVIALKEMKRHDERMEFCRISIDHYTIYCLEGLQPKIEKMRKKGRLARGK